MKILRLGKNGMVRSQNGTWYKANYFDCFQIKQRGDKFCLMGENGLEDWFLLGSFTTEKEAQAELDSLFGENEA